MRILYHHRTQCKRAEGVHVRETVRALTELGNEVHVVSPPGIDLFESSPKQACKPSRGLKRFWMFISKNMPAVVFEFLEILYNFISYRNIKAVMVKQKIDFIYERFTFFAFSANIIARKNKVPYVLEINYTTHTPLFRKKSGFFLPLARYIEKKNLRDADAIFVVSSFLRDQLIGLGVDKDKIYLTPNAVNEKVFNSDYHPGAVRVKYELKDAFVIGFVGGFYPWHGLNFLLKAVKGIEQEKKGLCLFLVGEGPMRDELTQTACELKLSSRLVFPGTVGYDDLPSYIKAMDICVMPNSNDYGSPMKIFEYMAMAKPVVAPRLSPIEDVITDKLDGVLFQPQDIDSFKNCLAGLYDDLKTREAIGKKAKDTILSNHLWKHNAKKVLQAYRETTKAQNEILNA